MLRSILAFSVICLSVGLGGCDRSDDKAKTADSSKAAVPGEKTAASVKGTIGVSVLTLTNPFFKVIGDTITAEARKQGYDTIVVSGDFDVAKQQNQVKDFIVRHCAAIVLCPCDSRAIGPAIKEANEANIPVFTADIATLAEGVKVVSHIATDNYAGGKQAGTAMIEALGEAGLELRRQVDLGHQHQRLTPCSQGPFDGTKVDLRLAASGHAVQEGRSGRGVRRDRIGNSLAVRG